LKKALVLWFLLAFLIPSFAQAALTTIGTATYESSEYKLIWDDDNNGNSVVWLDYTNDADTWERQMAWAANLGDELTINLYDGYSVEWDNDAWRLPSTIDGVYVEGFDGTTTAGWNITTSEMGHLFYEELGNLGYFDTVGNSRSVYGLQYTGDFENLVAYWYWSDTEYANAPPSPYAWAFGMHNGCKHNHYEELNISGLALNTTTITVSAVPIPGAVWLLGSCIGIVGLRKKLKR
jgi:hypothetical protein